MRRSAAQGRRPAAWYAAGVVLITVGLAVLWWPRGRSQRHITGRVAAELAPSDRVDAVPGSLRDWNVLLVTIDTTRADHLGCYGNRGIETPVLDQLARDGVLLAQAISPVPATLPAHATMMTGLYPYHHGVRANGTFKLSDEQTTLAEILHQAGYRTAAAISAFVLDGQYGLDQGFEQFADDLTRGIQYSPQMFRERPAELTNEWVFPWLDANVRNPFFLWVHYFDPHAVYLPPEPYRSRYADRPYDGEIAYVDEQIGRLLNHLDTLGIRERTLVIVTSDHGEGLGQHGEQTHSLLVYDATLHVPLILSAPGRIDAGKVVRRQVGLVDLMPTVLDLLGLPAARPSDGRSLLQPPGPGAPRPVYIETLSTMTLHGWAPLLGVRRDDFKLILAPEPELYDLAADPGEEVNLFEQRPEVAAELQQELIAFVGDDPWLAARAQQNLPLDPASVRHLRALGYISSAPEDAGEADFRQLPDPKVMVHHWEKVQHGVSMRNTGDIPGAIAVLEDCLAEVPRDVWSLQILGGAYALYGEADRALATFQRASELSPGEMAPYLGMAHVHISRRRLDAARDVLARAETIDPESGDLFVAKSFLAYCSGDEQEAFRLAKKAVALDPGSAGPRAYHQIGSMHFNAGRMADARAAFEQAIAIDAFHGGAQEGLARIAIHEGDREQAKRRLDVALRYNPAQPRALATRGGLLADEGKLTEALETLRRALNMSPTFGPALNNMALVYRRQGKYTQAEAAYQKAIEHNPFFDLPYVNLGQLYLKQQNEDAAVEQFQLALRANRYNPVALANVGTYHLKSGRLDRACVLLRRAVRVDPDYALAHKYLGVIYAELRMPWQSIRHLKRSLELDPDVPEAGKIRGMVEQLESARHPL